MTSSHTAKPLVLLAAIASLTVAAPAATIVDLGTLGGSQSEGIALNSSGQVVGTAITDENHAFLYSAGVMTDLGWGVAYGINSAGQVVGFGGGVRGTPTSDSLAAGLYRAYGINDSGIVVGQTAANSAAFVSGGQVVDLGPLLNGPNPGSGVITAATAINGAGQIVGYGVSNAFLYSGGSVTSLGAGRATAINSSGQVVGYSADFNNTSATSFLYSGGVRSDLGTLAGSHIGIYRLGRIEAMGINDAGQVVGWAESLQPQFGPDDNGDIVLLGYAAVRSAFVYWGGIVTDLNSLLPQGSQGWNLQTANAINNSGQIVGYGLKDNQLRAFLLNTAPVNSAPEPSSFAMLTGAGALLLAARRSRLPARK